MTEFVTSRSCLAELVSGTFMPYACRISKSYVDLSMCGYLIDGPCILMYRGYANLIAACLDELGI